VTVLSPKGVPTPPFSTRLIPPSSSMSPLPDAELAQRISSSPQVREYAKAVDRDSARERLASRVTPQAAAPPAAPGQQGEWQPAPAPAQAPRRGAKEPPSTFDQILKSPLTRTVAGTITRGIMGALLGTRRRSSSRW
jgi:hypothetical protein